MNAFIRYGILILQVVVQADEHAPTGEIPVEIRALAFGIGV